MSQKRQHPRPLVPKQQAKKASSKDITPSRRLAIPLARKHKGKCGVLCTTSITHQTAPAESNEGSMGVTKHGPL